MIGVLLGTAVSIFKVFLLEYTVNNALTMEKTKASGYVSIQYILRFLLYRYHPVFRSCGASD